MGTIGMLFHQNRASIDDNSPIYHNLGVDYGDNLLLQLTRIGQVKKNK
jgi:hypothetical protein